MKKINRENISEYYYNTTSAIVNAGPKTSLALNLFLQITIIISCLLYKDLGIKSLSFILISVISYFNFLNALTNRVLQVINSDKSTFAIFLFYLCNILNITILSDSNSVIWLIIFAYMIYIIMYLSISKIMGGDKTLKVTKKIYNASTILVLIIYVNESLAKTSVSKYYPLIYLLLILLFPLVYLAINIPNLKMISPQKK